MNTIIVTKNKDYIATMSAEEAFDMCASICGSFLVCLNELSDTYMVDVLQMLSKDKKLWRHQIKKNARMAHDALRQNISHALRHVKPENKPFYYEYVDSYTTKIRKDVDILYWTINQTLTKAGYGDKCDLLSRMEVQRLLLLLTCKGFEETIADIKRRSNFDMTEYFRGYKPAGAFFYWCRLVDEVFKKNYGKDVNLNGNKEVKTAYKVLLERLITGAYLDEAAADTLEANYDILTDELKLEYGEVRERMSKRKKMEGVP